MGSLLSTFPVLAVLLKPVELRSLVWCHRVLVPLGFKQCQVPCKGEVLQGPLLRWHLLNAPELVQRLAPGTWGNRASKRKF